MLICVIQSYLSWEYRINMQIWIKIGILTWVQICLRLCLLCQCSHMLNLSCSVPSKPFWRSLIAVAISVEVPMLLLGPKRRLSNSISTCMLDQNTWCISNTLQSWFKYLSASCMVCSFPFSFSPLYLEFSICMLLRDFVWLTTLDSLLFMMPNLTWKLSNSWRKLPFSCLYSDTGLWVIDKFSLMRLENLFTMTMTHTILHITYSTLMKAWITLTLSLLSLHYSSSKLPSVHKFQDYAKASDYLEQDKLTKMLMKTLAPTGVPSLERSRKNGTPTKSTKDLC